MQCLLSLCLSPLLTLFYCDIPLRLKFALCCSLSFSISLMYLLHSHFVGIYNVNFYIHFIMQLNVIAPHTKCQKPDTSSQNS